MASKIEWLWPPGYKGEAWNPITGCTKVSPGCANCYAERMAIRFNRNGGSYLPGKAVIEFHPERLDQPFHWKQPRCVFVNSVSDIFHEQIRYDQVDQIFAVMWMNPSHIFIILTKRHMRMYHYLTSRAVLTRGIYNHLAQRGYQGPALRWPLPNVWVGVSVENQHFADERIPILRQVPAAVKWVSVEPILGFIDFEDHFQRHDQQGRNVTDLAGLWDPTDTLSVDWAVFGGESGPGARPPHPDWIYRGISQAQNAGIPSFFKQWGEYRPFIDGDTRVNRLVTFRRGISDPGDPNAVRMVNVGKTKAGALLLPDGYAPFELREFPNILKETA